MTNSPLTAGIVPARLPATDYARNFADSCPPFDGHAARVAADRCYFCHDAPCITACPTAIDIPLFIRQIATGLPQAAARTIWSQNILGGICARVCPTETLCEGACVREAAEGKPVEIGRLQRYATDAAMAAPAPAFHRAPRSGRKVAVVGAGPAGLACAHRLALLGHEVVIYEKRPKAGGLNEYGIASYKAVGGFAQAEVDWLLQIGGIEIRTGMELGRDLTLAGLQQDYDAVFLALGLQGVNGLGIAGESLSGVRDAVDFIAELRQCSDLSRLPIGRNVVVIGGGMTAIDAAVQAKLLGAETVTIVYRRTRAQMSASRHEQEHAAQAGVRLIYEAVPRALIGSSRLEAIDFAYSGQGGDAGMPPGFRLAADQLLKAIGQRLSSLPEGVGQALGKIAALPAGVWAGGDCAAGGVDLTVTAVAQGRDAAHEIHHFLSPR